MPVARQSGGRALYQPIDPLASLSETEKVKLLERIEQICRSLDPRVTQVMASLAGRIRELDRQYFG